jgi:hypothetical protein
MAASAVPSARLTITAFLDLPSVLLLCVVASVFIATAFQ